MHAPPEPEIVRRLAPRRPRAPRALGRPRIPLVHAPFASGGARLPCSAPILQAPDALTVKNCARVRAARARKRPLYAGFARTARLRGQESRSCMCRPSPGPLARPLGIARPGLFPSAVAPAPRGGMHERDSWPRIGPRRADRPTRRPPAYEKPARPPRERGPGGLVGRARWAGGVPYAFTLAAAFVPARRPNVSAVPSEMPATMTG